MNNEKITIYVVTHKKYDIVEDEMYKPLFAGAKFKKDTFGYLRDDEGLNISERNPYYSEVSGLYWMWKHSEADIIGLCHYRRYFNKNIGYRNILKKSDVEKILKGYDIILLKTLKSPGNNYDTVIDFLYDDLNECKKLIHKMCPEYDEAFENFFKKTGNHPFNMFIMPKEILNDYCNWLFPILFELENILDYKSYEGNHKRVFAYLAELIFNVWIEKNNNLKIKECYPYYVEYNTFLVNCRFKFLFLTRIYFFFCKNKYFKKLFNKYSP